MRADERVRRWLDGELSGAEEEALLLDAEGDAELAALLSAARVTREALAPLRDAGGLAPPAGLAERALAVALAERERARAGSPGARLLRAFRPRWVRVRVTPAVLLLPVAAAALLWLLGREAVRPDLPAPGVVAKAVPPQATPTDEVPVRFVLPAAGAHTVAVAGDFNGWSTDALPLSDSDGDGVFAGTIRLPRGAWTYMYVVDGERWVTDPFAQSYRDDGFGGQNAVLRID